MGGLIFLTLLVGIMVMFPPSAILIIPFVVISVLVGLGMRSIGESMTEPVRSELHNSAKRIAEAIESLRSECCQSANVGRIRTRENYCYGEPALSSLTVLL